MADDVEELQPIGAAVGEKTWWHPVFADLLSWLLNEVFHSEKEVSVSMLPKSIDLVALRNPPKELSQWVTEAAPSLFSRLKTANLLEFKGPTSSLRNGDMARMLARVGAWHARQKQKPQQSEVVVLFVAPAITKGFKEELKLLGMSAVELDPGIHRIDGMIFETWVIGTVEGSKRGEPLLSLMSPQLLKNSEEMVDKLESGGYLALLSFVVGQVRQFRQANPAMPIPTLEIENMGKYTAEMEREIIQLLGPEHVVKHLSTEDRLRGLPPEERLKGLPPEERLKGLPPEERLKGLPPEERLKGVPPEERLKGVPPEERLKGLPPEERLKGVPLEERLRGLPVADRLKGLTPDDFEEIRSLLAHSDSDPAQN